MRKNLLAGVVVIGIIIVGVLFYRWWQSRLALENSLTATPVPIETATALPLPTFAAHIPAAQQWKFEPQNGASGSGVLNYQETPTGLSATVVVDQIHDGQQLGVWFVGSADTMLVGKLLDEKSGLVADVLLPNPWHNGILVIAPMTQGERLEAAPLFQLRLP